jgi:hypothetical protein
MEGSQMQNIDLLLYLVAFVCFVIAACPHKSQFRPEWFGAAAITLSLII